VGKVIWSAQALAVAAALPPEARAALERRLGYLREMPRMYQLALDERFPGCRTFWLEPAYRVFYMVSATGDDVYLTAIVPEPVEESL